MNTQRPEVWLYYGVAQQSRNTHSRRGWRRSRRRCRICICRHAFSRPDADGSPGRDFTHHGRAAAHLFDASLVARRARFYLCGPGRDDGGLTAALVGQACRVSRFSRSVSSRRALARCRTAPRPRIRLTLRRRASLTWTADSGSILDLAEKNGIASRPAAASVNAKAASSRSSRARRRVPPPSTSRRAAALLARRSRSAT